MRNSNVLARGVAALTLCVAVVVAAAPDGAARTVPIGDTGYQVTMPDAPTPSTRTTKSPLGSIVTHLSTLRRDHVILSADNTPLPGAAILFSGRDQIYDHARGHLLHTVLGKQIAWRTVQVAGHDARELRYRTPAHDGGPSLDGRAQFILVDKTLIVLDAMRPVTDGPAATDAFFESFTRAPAAP